MNRTIWIFRLLAVLIVLLFFFLMMNLQTKLQRMQPRTAPPAQSTVR